MEEISSESEDSSYSRDWIDWFLSLRGNEFFCEIDSDYILDKFNLTGLNNEVEHYGPAINLITDRFDDDDIEDDTRDDIEKSARHLYGLIHARFVVTSRGLAKMADKYRNGDFTRCPRVFCQQQPLLPVGLTDVPHQKCVKLYCPSCEDLYNPKSARHASIDGAYFGTSLPQMLLMVYPQLAVYREVKRYQPTIFGFKIWEVEVLHQMQDDMRSNMEAEASAPVANSFDEAQEMIVSRQEALDTSTDLQQQTVTVASANTQPNHTDPQRNQLNATTVQYVTHPTITSTTNPSAIGRATNQIAQPTSIASASGVSGPMVINSTSTSIPGNPIHPSIVPGDPELQNGSTELV